MLAANQNSVTAPAFLTTNKKVTTVSDRLQTPTAAIENGKWRGPEVTPLYIDGRDRYESDVDKKRLSIKPVTMTEHFLTPTSATINGSKISKVSEEEKTIGLLILC